MHRYAIREHYTSSIRKAPCLVGCLLFALTLLWTFTGRVYAQVLPEVPPPEQGQRIVSMGRPIRTRYFIAGEVGLKPIEDREFVGTLALGFDRTIGNPMVPALGISAEYFTGISGQAGGEVGVRAGIESPVLRFGWGVQYEFREDKTRTYWTFRHPLKRGGVFWRGGQVRVMWMPGEDQSLRVGVTVPLGQPFAGRTRPLDSRASVPLQVADRPPAFQPPGSDSREALKWLSVCAANLYDFVAPYIDHDARKREDAVAAFATSMTGLKLDLETVSKTHLSHRSMSQGEPAALMAAREFRAALTEAFGATVSSGKEAENLTGMACWALLD